MSVVLIEASVPMDSVCVPLDMKDLDVNSRSSVPTDVVVEALVDMATAIVNLVLEELTVLKT